MENSFWGRNAWLLAATAIATLAPTLGWAQTDQVAGQSAGNGGIETIVVTAQRRAEDIRDVPISITAVSAQTLEDRDIRSFHDIQNIAPNFQSLQLGDSRTSVMRLRGVTSQQTNAGQQSSVANYIDGVFMSRTGMGTTQDLFDIERVEVLRGPQGDLFGMNTAAGLVNVITRNPNLSNFEGLAELEAGTWGNLNARARLSGPIIEDTLGVSLSGYFDSHGGYTHNVITGRNVDNLRKLGVRGKVQYVSGNFTATVTADYQHETSECCAAIITKLSPGANFLGAPLAPIAPAGYPFSRATVQGARNTNPNHGGGVSAELVWDFAPFSVTSLTAIRYWDATPVSDIDSLPFRGLDNFYIAQKHKQVSEEIRITSPSGQQLEYIAGLFFFNRSSTDYENIALGPDTPAFLTLPGTDGATVTDARINDTSYAVFGHIDYHWTDRFTTSAGLRYTREPQQGSFTQTSNNLAFRNLGTIDAKRDEGALTWRLNASYKWTPDIMTYVSIARGFKPGGFNMTRIPDFDNFQFKPETNINYEAGVKSSLFDNRATLNISAYYTNYDNFQALAFNGTDLITKNAGSFVTKGFEIEAEARPFANLTLTSAIGFVDAHFTYFPDGQCPVGMAGACDLKGYRLSGVPRWTYNGSAQYEIPLSASWDGYVQADYEYTGDIYFQQNLDPSAYGRAHGVINAHIGVRSDEGLSAEIYASNLTDSKYVNFVYPSPLSTGAYVGYLGNPRIIGARIRKAF
jgi:iron complex outermembrane receptor protein